MVTDNFNIGINSIGNGLCLNRWYHLIYILSEPEKRLDFYIDGKWAGFKSFKRVQSEHIMFNYGPLYIGYDSCHAGGFIGLIRIWPFCVDEQHNFEGTPVLRDSSAAIR
ncbi:9829_t:CDS:2 [Ambispora leptoticha]|uniref:9829_t:CDS:1 n=1 Tax=Ambispora leptoticha TaxID=144679 RepID=A0A9N9B283_9GLOM|nr:9829_t:CDS:2 [Ambispora leptoticha]